MKTTIIMRVPLDRPPTEEDRWNQVCADDFNKLLMAEGWTDENGTVVKPFRIEHVGHTEDGDFYIEWRAVLRQE